METTGGPEADRDREFDAICDRFEEAWKSGSVPEIGRYLAAHEADPDFRDRLAAELRALDDEYRRIQALPTKALLDSARPASADGPPDLRAATADTAAQLPRRGVMLMAGLDDLRFHARGGLGEIYRARDVGLHRDVAVKFVRSGLGGEDSQARFVVEAEITGRLDHPGVVPVYGLGQGPDGRPFIAMRFIEGRTLTAAIDEFHATRHASAAERRRELNRLLTHLIAACNTVAYAHSRGILHRDIKPDNIMIGRFSETLVVDWGLAVPITRDERARSSGEQTMHLSADSGGSTSSRLAAGTIGYVSPEATRDGQPDIDARSDVYGLGATLFHVLTGQRSVQGPPDSRVVAAIRAGDFPSPRDISPHVPRQLDAVCRVAMATLPPDRYSTPLDLAADLEAYIADEPVSVLRQTIVDRVRRAARSNRVAVATALLALAGTAAIGLVSSVWLGRQAVRERAALEAAEAANRDSLRLAASFAAQTVAGEIDIRWRILESLARDAELARLLTAAADRTDSTSWPELQAWLTARQSGYADVNADSWFVTDKRGIQVARFPAGASSIGGDYSGRDYFHGLGYQAAAGAGLQPIKAPHISSSYVSSNDQRLKIAFTVPIWAPDDRDHVSTPIGVIGLSSPAGGFRILHRGLSSGQVGVLVDVRETRRSSDSAGRSGEILHHPGLRVEQLKAIAGTGTPQPLYLDPDLTDRLQTLRKVRAAAFSDQQESSHTIPEAGAVMTDFAGSLPGDGPGVWLAAFEPVLIAGRPPELRDPGLVVLVQQRAE